MDCVIVVYCSEVVLVLIFFEGMIGDEFIVYYIIGSICLFYSGIICKVVCWYIGKKVDGIGIVIGYVYGVEVVIVYWFWVVDVGGKFGRGIIRVVVYVVLYL